jgi:hypothetical protein
MTPREQTLTDHLAEKVCGWTVQRETLLYGCSLVLYRKPDGELAVPSPFDPLHDPRDTSLVMEAWRQEEHTLVLDLDNASKQYTAIADYDESHEELGEPSESWTEAVCEAIGKASGWKVGE